MTRYLNCKTLTLTHDTNSRKPMCEMAGYLINSITLIKLWINNDKKFSINFKLEQCQIIQQLNPHAVKECLGIAYCLSAKPWNQSGKLPLLRMSDACVSINHRSTSSFRPLSDTSMLGLTSDCWLILQALLFRSSLTCKPPSPSSDAWLWKGKWGRSFDYVPFFYLYGLNGFIVPNESCHLAPLVTLKASFYYHCSFFLHYTSRYYHFFQPLLWIINLV